MSNVDESYVNKLFVNGLYTIWATEPGNSVAVEADKGGPYPVGTTYKIDFIKESALEIPLALLYATFQIALSDVANYQAESYMNKIVTNQEIQTASSCALAEAEQMEKNLNSEGTTQQLTEDFLQECYTAGITEINDKQLCQVDNNGEVILTYEKDKDGNDIPGTGTPTFLTNITLTADDLDALITELEIAQEKASSSTQEDMVFAEEYLGQYTSYLSGGSSNIDDLNNALQGIAQRI